MKRIIVSLAVLIVCMSVVWLPPSTESAFPGMELPAGTTLLQGHNYMQIATGADNSFSFSIDAQDYIHVVYPKQVGTKQNLYYKKFHPNHTPATDEILLYSPSTGFVKYPKILFASDTLHICFSSNETGNYDVYYMRVDTNGTTLLPPLNIIGNFGVSTATDVPFGMDYDKNGNIYVVICRSQPNRAMITRVDATGVQSDWNYRGTIGKIFYINGDVPAEFPRIVIEREKEVAHITYGDMVASGGWLSDEYYLSFNVSTGNTVVTPVGLENYGDGSSNGPVVVDTSGRVHAFWHQWYSSSATKIWAARLSPSGVVQQTFEPLIDTPIGFFAEPGYACYRAQRIYFASAYDYPDGDHNMRPHLLVIGESENIITNLTRISNNYGMPMGIEFSSKAKLHIAYTTGLTPPVELGISYEPHVDPAIMNFTASEMHPYEGQSVELKAEIENLGYDVLDSATLKFYENPPEQGGALIGSAQITNLNGSANIAVSTTWIAKQGYYNLTAIISSSTPEDSDITNNRSTIFIRVGKPDLEISETNITLSNTAPMSGELITITGKVNNLGDGRAENVKVRFYLDGILLGTDITLPVIEPRSYTFVQTQWIASSGTHTLAVNLDPGNQIEEENETNNNATRQIYVDANLPDFVAGSIVLESSMVAGTQANATLTIANAGNVNATAKIKVVHNTAIALYTQEIPAHSTINITHQFMPVHGTNTIEVFVDPDHEVMETEENNNCATITFMLLPDLEISPTNITNETAEQGWDFNLSAKVCNLGGVDVYNIAFKVVEGNGTISAGYIQFVPAYSYAYYNFSMNTTPGWHLLKFVVDCENMAIEANESNNEALFSIFVSPLPDLVVQGLSITPGEIDEITEIMVRATVLNSGTAPAHNLSVSFYLDGAEFEVDKVSTLNPNESLVFTGKCIAAHGQRTITFKADPEDKIKEVSEANNEATKTIEVAPLPDLMIENLSVSPEKIDVRTEAHVNLTVKNEGWKTATNITVAFYIDGIKFESHALFSLNPEQHISITEKCTLVEGTHILSVRLDPENNVKELSEENNEATQVVEVASLPDLVVQGIEISPMEIDEASDIIVNATVWNCGGVFATNFTVDFLIDGVVMVTTNVPQLSAGEALVCTARIVAESGSRVLEVRVDTKNIVKELSEANNEAMKTFEVLPLPDLTVGNLCLPSQMFLGFETQISVTLANNGHEKAENFSLEIFAESEVIASTTVPVLYPGAIAQINFTWIPDYTGSKVLTAIVDRENEIKETNETNNGFQANAIVAIALCDVSVEVKVRAEGLKVLAPAEILITLKNNGVYRAELNLSVYIDNAVYDTRTMVIEPGSALTLNLTYIWVSPGTKRVRAEVSLPQNLTDNNTQNNVATESVVVTEEAVVDTGFIWQILAVVEGILILLLLVYIVLGRRKQKPEIAGEALEKEEVKEGQKKGEDTGKKKY
ncbi:MAG: CARDB domain-containing protein [Thermoplasmata archaeon]